MDQAGCTNTGIVSNEISDNVSRELWGFQKPILVGNSDKILEPNIGVDYDSYTHDNDESEIGNTDNCYQHVQSGESNSTTHFVQIKSEPHICAKSSYDVTCTENEVSGSPRNIQNEAVPIKMEPITCDAFDPSCCMLTDKMSHKSGKNSLHEHEQLDHLLSSRTNYAICIKYEPGLRTQQRNVNIKEDKEQGEKPLTPKQKYTKIKYKCDLCSYSTMSSSILKRHKRKHTGEKPYKCDVCSYCTVRSHDLVRHKRKHTGEKPYMCEVCSYSTARPGDLGRHNRIHTGEIPHTCDMCSYSTVSSSDLVRHKRKHTGDKPYKCDACSFTTTRSNHLAEHQLRHTGEKPYKCDVCSYSTVSSRKFSCA